MIPAGSDEIMDAHSFWMFSPAIVLWGLLAAAVWHDLRSRRIPNRLVFPGALLGLLINSVPLHVGGVLAPVAAPLGLLMGLAGFAAGLALLLPLYALKTMGAGDVKLMAMIGAFLGPYPVAIVTLFSLLAGGVMAVIVAAWNGTLRRVTANSYHLLLQSLMRGIAGDMPSIDAPALPSGKLPYALAIATGTLIYLGLAARGALGVFA